MAFSFGYSPWLLVLSLLIAGGLTYWSYRSTVPALSAGWRGLLGSLRFFALALICFLLLEPVVRQLSETEQPPVLAVLVDNSQSMRVVSGEDTDTSADAVRDRLRSALAPLRDDLPGTARYFGFDRSLRSLPDASLDSLTLRGRRSDLGAALQSIPEELEGENLRGVALISDGQYNSGQNPARVADRFSVPVHTITVGDTTRRRDLQVRRAATNDIAYVDTEVPVQVTLGVEDLGGALTTVSLQNDGSVLDTAEVSLPSGTAERTVSLSFQPQSPGLKQLTVRASAVEGETTTQNNVRTVSLRVLDNKRQVLLLGAAPSPNYTALRRVLAQDANTSVTARVPRMDGSFYGGSLPDSLTSFDVIVCAGFPSSVVSDNDVQRIADVMNDGTPSLFVLDRQTDVGAWQKHFSSLLPVLPNGASLQFAEAAFTPLESQQTHPVFQVDGTDVSLFRRLPPLSIPATAWTPTPDAQVLAAAARPSLSQRVPVLVVRRRAGQRTAALLGTGTWRWATLPADLETAAPLWPGIVSNLLRWVATQSDDRQVRVQPVSSTFEGDQPVEFTGQVYDGSMTPVSKAQVSVTITDSSGTDYPHSMEPVGNGRYSLRVGSLPEGTYRYSAQAQLDQNTLGQDRGQFSVGALRLEYQQTRANPVLMRQIATRSGGNAYTAETASALPSDLAASTDFTSNIVTSTTEAELWRTSLFLAVILVLLAAEWTLRKRFGLT
ncbi:hypothetical protein BSZ35_05575 [Salinibacter sp. 10B]|uniref:hypothetical protein n=1 Tax=Salinibacter sp. 10B TaxID=1923971 RepID=UPI000CF50F79|nr:hypothetical protein [Salinibacter sp. 10B]PQJ34142.1 hypothetical protein BSZ35_05575 [Salinibacter sp. 10B]